MKKEYKTVALSEIRPYPNNPRINDEAAKDVAKSIQQCGYIAPIVVDEDMVILAGHTRAKALESLGKTEVDIIIVSGLSDAQKRKYRLLDNKTNELSDWDFDLLEQELADLDFGDLELDWGIDLDDEPAEAVEDDYDAEPPEEPRAKMGDIYQLGRHRLMCGDSTNAEDVKKLLDGVRTDMILSDPPYGMHLDTDFSDCIGSIGRKNHTRGNKYDSVIGDNEDFTPELIQTFFDNFGDCKEMFLFGADYYAELLPDKNEGSWLVWDKRKESQADAIGSEFELIWSKSKHKRRMLRHDWFGFLSSEDSKDAQNRVHPTQKPVSLLADIINQWGKKAETIVDLYGGSGSTLIACEQLGKTCYTCEIEPRYIDVIIDRYEKFTNQKAVKIGS